MSPECQRYPSCVRVRASRFSDFPADGLQPVARRSGGVSRLRPLTVFSLGRGEPNLASGKELGSATNLRLPPGGGYARNGRGGRDGQLGPPDTGQDPPPHPAARTAGNSGDGSGGGRAGPGRGSRVAPPATQDPDAEPAAHSGAGRDASPARQASATGDRSVAIAGDSSAPISTGDHSPILGLG